MKIPIFYLIRIKQTVSKPLFATALFLSLFSCSSSDDGGGTPIIPTPQPVTENIWSLDNYSFSRRVSVQTNTTYTNGDPFTQIYVDSNIMSGNDKFKYCNLVPTFNTSTEGTYTIKSQNTLVADTQSKTMWISCTVGDGNGNGAMYSSGDTTIPTTVSLVNGKFVFTVSENVTLTKTLDDGLDAPQTVVFKCNKVQ